MIAKLAVGVTTRDRPGALARCLRSLTTIAHLSPEVLVFDDASTLPASNTIDGLKLTMPIRVLRDETAPGYIAGRNRIVREATSEAVLLMDDDAALMAGTAIERALTLFESDRHVAAIAFAQADQHGTPWDASMQPGRSTAASYVPSFIGFAHMVRRRVFLEIGGYRESFNFYGEEKDFCLRLIEAGYRTVYLPDALVIHEPDREGRSHQRYLRYVTRNDCLAALYNEPWHRAAWMIPGRLLLYFRMRRAWQIDDPGGWFWIVRELWTHLGSILRDRKPVSADTLAVWKRLRQTPEAYVMPPAAAERAPTISAR
jgi:GT2 family glycosyltransferase